MLSPKTVTDFIFTREPSTIDKLLGKSYKLKFFSKVLDEYNSKLSISQLVLIKQCVEDAMNEYAKANQVVLVRVRRPGFAEWKYEFTDDSVRKEMSSKDFFKEVSILAENKIKEYWNDWDSI